MRFNLLLYVATLTETPDVDFGIFIQHHFMDDADIQLDYFDFSKINPENYALDIVEKNPITPQVRRDCLVEGFTLSSYLTINLSHGFNRNIHVDDVRQIFICFKTRSQESIDAFIRLTKDQVITDYQIHNQLIFFRLWVAPELTTGSNAEFNIAKINYSNFDYFCETVKSQLNQQWHSVLKEKRAISKSQLKKDDHNNQFTVNEKPEPTPAVKLTDIYSLNDFAPPSLGSGTVSETNDFESVPDSSDWLESQKIAPQNDHEIATIAPATIQLKQKKQGRFWPLMGYFLLFLVLSSMFEGLFR